MNIIEIASKIAPANAGLLQILGFINDDPEITDLREIAYMLATVHHETSGTFMPIEERGQRRYFDQYEPGTKKAKRLGNDVHGDGYMYRGRGYCQITGKLNYRRFSALLKINLLQNPELALDPFNAYSIISIGMRDGVFTGRAFEHYFNDTETDWVNARKIINGTDCAEKIADKAIEYFEILKANI